MMATDKRSPFSNPAYRAAYRAQAIRRNAEASAAQQRQDDAARERRQHVVAALDPRRIYARQNGKASDRDLEEATTHLDENTRRAYEAAPELALEASEEEIQKRLAYAAIYARLNAGKPNSRPLVGNADR